MRGLLRWLADVLPHVFVSMVVAVALRLGLGVGRDLADTAAILVLVLLVVADDVVARLTQEQR